MAITPPDDVAYQTDTFTALTPVDWTQELLAIFQDDETYGFNNRLNPDKDVFKNFAVVLSAPESITDIPALWMTVETITPSLETTPTSFLSNFMAQINIFIVCMRNTFIEYNDLTWTIPSSMDPQPTNNLFWLLIEYVGQKLSDNGPTISGTGYKIMLNAFIDMEFFYTGFNGNPEGRAVRIGQIVEVQLT